MNKPQINLIKGSDSKEPQKELIQDMQSDMLSFINVLAQGSNRFDVVNAYNDIKKYIKKHKRILYSTISNEIYKRHETSDNMNNASSHGTILTNITTLLGYSENIMNDFSNKKKEYKDNEEKELYEETSRAIIKIWDHISLACHQYEKLKQTDEEYGKRFKNNISQYKNEMTKEMHSQLITMVGIFTALAFLVFGSISSLDGIFEDLEMPLLKVISVGLIWGLCVLNMIFIFLYCISKMTKLDFKSDKNTALGFFKEYPIVCITDLILISLLMITSWGYFVQKSPMYNSLVEWIKGNKKLSLFIGSGIVLCLIITSTIIILVKCFKGKNKRT